MSDSVLVTCDNNYGTFSHDGLNQKEEATAICDYHIRKNKNVESRPHHISNGTCEIPVLNKDSLI